MITRTSHNKHLCETARDTHSPLTNRPTPSHTHTPPISPPTAPLPSSCPRRTTLCRVSVCVCVCVCVSHAAAVPLVLPHMHTQAFSFDDAAPYRDEYHSSPRTQYAVLTSPRMSHGHPHLTARDVVCLCVSQCVLVMCAHVRWVRTCATTKSEFYLRPQLTFVRPQVTRL